MRMCSKCHAEVAETVEGQCPGCGGVLVARAAAGGVEIEEPGSVPRVVDHRGILLPRRHLVGGVISPR